MNRNTGRARRRPSERGAAAVEMAIILPVLVFLVFGIIDFGRMLNAQIILTEAAREGARAAALEPAGTTQTQMQTDVQDRVDKASPSLNPVPPLNSGNRKVVATVTPAAGCTGASPTDATVTTTYTFQFVTPIGPLAVLFGGTFTGTGVKQLKGTGVMPCLA